VGHGPRRGALCFEAAGSFVSPGLTRSFAAPLRGSARRARTIALVLGGLAGVFAIHLLLQRSRDFSPDFLASVFLYGLTVANLTLLLVLLFVLGRQLVRLVMERRRGVLGSRFRTRLVLVFLLIAVAPSTLLILVGSNLIQQTVDRWFNVDVGRMLSSAQALDEALRVSATERSRVQARVLAAEVSRGRLLDAGQSRLRRTIERRARELGVDMVSVHKGDSELVAVVDPRLPQGRHGGLAVEALTRAALLGREAETSVPFERGELLQVAVPVRGARDAVVGAIVASTYIDASVAAEAREVRLRYDKFTKTEALRGPIKVFYLSLYMLPALAVLFGAVWLSLYLAKRISIPLRLVSEGAERITAGERGVQVDFPAENDEFAALITSFNRMSERLARSEEELEHGRAGLTRKNRELEERRHLMETVLETVGTGILVVDADGCITAINAAGRRLLGLGESALGRRLEDVLTGSGREEVPRLVRRLLSGRVTRHEREIRVFTGGRDRHLAVTIVPLTRGSGAPPGAVVVVDDLTPLMTAQKVAAWGEVARKLAHEIKNPLTPIQLSAQRIAKAHLKGSPDLVQIVNECTGAIVQEVDALKNLVDEFAQFARLPPVQLSVVSLHEVVDQTLSLYDGQFPDISFERELSPGLPAVRIDATQIKRVLINLIDNAIEALGRSGTVTIETQFDKTAGVVRVSVADDGPGISQEARDKLFVPSFSTKRRGTGLGLAIVSLIVREHQGSVRVEDNEPAGARFIVELPA